MAQISAAAQMATKTKVLVPLYIYPLNEDSWKTLYKSIAQYPDVEFVVIVNPNSGPYAEFPNGQAGHLSLPGHDYCREVPRLTACRNVTAVGYIRVDYCKKPLSQVFAEMETYANWARSPGMGLGGVFVDETPNHYSAERVDYLIALQHGLKTMDGFSRPPLIIQNPGTSPHPQLAATADAVVVCEEPYHRFQSSEVQQWLFQNPLPQATSAYQISGVPKSEVFSFTRAVRDRAAYVFVTDLNENFYESFGDSWGDFVAALA